jgi:hypothetical protein
MTPIVRIAKTVTTARPWRHEEAYVSALVKTIGTSETREKLSNYLLRVTPKIRIARVERRFLSETPAILPPQSAYLPGSSRRPHNDELDNETNLLDGESISISAGAPEHTSHIAHTDSS